MAFNQRLVVFDMDGTLIGNSHTRLNGCLHKCIQLDYDPTIFVYVRPHMAETLIRCRDNPRNLIVLFSSGSFSYVHAVVNQVIYPEVRQIDPDFTFVSILTKDDMEGILVKPVNKLEKELKVESSIIIDDILEFCIYSGATNYYLIKQFDPMNSTDVALSHMLNSDYFEPL